ncbi:5,6-dimethylbenzimidazole synthase [bacterium AH-315-K03]|nr:5,6-dimethylbenzimidazole synthase [bacterium AH-315-K03]
MTKHAFDKHEQAAIYRAIFERRDMRHFIPGNIATETLERLFTAAHAAPSVGFMQPWRFIRISDPSLRCDIHQMVEQERIKTAHALGEREDEFMRLKVEGILDCSELIVVTLMDKRETHIFGRRTLPDMDLASAACAIQNMWLAARAEGLGMGWVSLFDPATLSKKLSMPKGSRPIAILCLGQVDEFYPEPMLEIEGWASKGDLANYIMENTWTQDSTSDKAD